MKISDVTTLLPNDKNHQQYQLILRSLICLEFSLWSFLTIIVIIYRRSFRIAYLVSEHEDGVFLSGSIAQLTTHGLPDKSLLSTWIM